MKPLRILSVVAARPNFMKIAPFMRALRARGGDACDHFLVHTGQHYDAAMAQAFFEALAIPAPDLNLGIGSGTHAEQVGRTMMAFEPVVRDWRPDWVVVVGDVNATLACAVTAKKEHVKLAHIEAGLRSGDLTMPEEINRMVTDRLADLLFTPDAIADANLRREGAPAASVKRVGNIMIDTLAANLAAARELRLDDILRRHRIAADGAAAGGRRPAGVEEDGFAMLTLHRPATVDRREILAPLVRFLADELSRELPLVWALHPRARKQLEQFGLWRAVVGAPGILPLQPVGYREMLRLNCACRLMLTDSGGLQEECCVLGTPCVTLRANTERPVTLEEHGGVCRLAGNGVDQIRSVFGALRQRPRRPSRPPLWDGRTAERIAAEFARLAEGN